MQAYPWMVDSGISIVEECVASCRTPSLYHCHTIMSYTMPCSTGLNPGKAVAKIKKTEATTRRRKLYLYCPHGKCDLKPAPLNIIYI